MRIELTTPGLQDQCSNHWAMEACADVGRVLHKIRTQRAIPDKNISVLITHQWPTMLGVTTLWLTSCVPQRGALDQTSAIGTADGSGPTTYHSRQSMLTAALIYEESRVLQRQMNVHSQQTMNQFC